ncbi:VanZ family protein [Loigolactobacillus binensis]|uniref:VanZ family protein n=1 Tax=Loigolactobacillus binensis TaxID=2559922 RepID=A0ABW3ECJ6_9LACO|nr:VanZ family protein [Loigolactobacillus binensis]
MIFLGPLYRLVAGQYADQINHFPLIRLIFYSLDKTLLYFLIFLALRLFYLWRRQRLVWQLAFWRRELYLWLVVIYLSLLFSLTALRGIYWPNQFWAHLQLSHEAINTTPFVETWKLVRGTSKFDFLYNLFGNILWFIPLGFSYGVRLRDNRRWLPVQFLQVYLLGVGVSLSIETLQYLLSTGIADIDDVTFNVLGGLVGFLLYLLWRGIRYCWYKLNGNP